MTQKLSRRILKSLALRMRAPMRLLLRLFFRQEFLTGRHFDTGLSGYKWAILAIWQRNILRLAPPLLFPASIKVTISNAGNIVFHPDDLNNFQSPGIYLQNFAGQIVIGRGSYIGPNVGIITANHDPLALDQHHPAQNVILGEGCWLGMNSVILPGVALGDRTIVGAGSIVTKSFPNGHCIIAGNPAKLIRQL